MSLKGRCFVKELDFTPQEFGSLLDLAAELKSAKRSGTESQRLAGRNFALIFEKTSTRTRCAFEVAAYDQGAQVTYLDPSGSQMGHKESIKDTARVLGRFYDGIEYRGSAQENVEVLARFAGVPVWNGLTDQWHPTQMLCDLLTMREHTAKADRDIAFAYVGDARHNMGSSLLVSGAMMGMDVRIAAPAPLANDEAVLAAAREIAARTGAKITVTSDPVEAVRGADFVHTDVWVSMGEPKQVWDERIALLLPYQVNSALLAASQNPDVKFMHCLPAYHDTDTVLGREVFERTGLAGLEVTDEVFESDASIVFDQAENRLHTIKAVMVATVAG